MLDKILAFIAKKLEGMPGRMRPVGSIYLSIDPTDPSTLFGGKWERIQGRFLLAASSSYEAGSTGGEATHTLTTDEMPIHNHNFSNHKYITMPSTGASPARKHVKGDSSSDIFAIASEDNPVYRNDSPDVGGSDAHNNMPPYLAVYIWKRIA